MAIGDQRKKLEDFKYSKGNQVRGAGLRCFCFKQYYDVMYDNLWCLYTVVILKYCVSEKFPETAWRVMNHRQATHLLCAILGFWEGNRLAAHSRPPGDAWDLH